MIRYAKLIAITVATTGVLACGNTEVDPNGASSGNGGNGGNAGSGGTGGAGASGSGGFAGNTTGGFAGTSTQPTCPPGSSPGCCYGDGGCCSCVGKVCDDWALGSDPGIPELTECVCQQDVCGEECDGACSSGGIDAACLPCVREAVSGACSEPFEMCIEDPPAWCSYVRERLLGVCVGSPDEGSAGAAGASGRFDGCGEGDCEVNLSGELIDLGTGAPSGCDEELFAMDDLETVEAHWFELDSDQGPVILGFATPAGGPALELGDALNLSFVRTDETTSLGIERDGELVAYAFRGALPPSVSGLELGRGVALCDEEFAQCRTVDHRLDATFDGRSLSLMPGETRALGPMSITVEQHKELLESEIPSCDPSELSFAVVRTER